MGLLTFKGGIHPDDGKRFSKDSEIRTLLPKGELAYPLSQHIGASAFIVSYIIKNSRNIRHPRINRPENYIFRTLLLLGYQVLRDLRERFHNIPGGS